MESIKQTIRAFIMGAKKFSTKALATTALVAFSVASSAVAGPSGLSARGLADSMFRGTEADTYQSNPSARGGSLTQDFPRQRSGRPNYQIVPTHTIQQVDYNRHSLQPGFNGLDGAGSGQYGWYIGNLLNDELKETSQPAYKVTKARVPHPSAEGVGIYPALQITRRPDGRTNRYGQPPKRDTVQIKIPFFSAEDAQEVYDALDRRRNRDAIGITPVVWQELKPVLKSLQNQRYPNPSTSRPYLRSGAQGWNPSPR